MISGWALMVVAVFWAVLVGFLSFALISLFRVLQATRDLVDDFRREVTPVIRELNETVENVNKEMQHVDGILTSAQGTAGSIESVAKTVQTVVTHPAIRIVSIAAGAAGAYRRLKKPPS